MILVTSPLMPAMDRYIDYLKQIWGKKWLTNNGPLCIQFQKELEERMGCSIELFTNGHMALDIAVKALELKGEVITTPYSFASTTHALVMNNCTPVFCDIRPDDYTIDAEKIEALITEKTTAIVPVHVYGCPCDTDRIREIANKYGLKVLYDAAHAFGVTVGGKPISDFGTVSMFSLHATKVFNSIEGGILAFGEDPEFGHKVRNLRNFGIEDEETVSSVGLNAKMNEFAAAMGLCNLEIVDSAIQRRREICERYLSVLQDLRGIRTLDYDAMRRRSVEYNYAYFPIEVDPEAAGFHRNQLADYLQAHGVGVRKYFYPLIPDYDCYSEQYGKADVPVARRVADRILTLPLAASMSSEDVELVCSVLLKAEKDCC